MTQSLRNVLLFSPVLILLISCGSTPKAFLTKELVKAAPDSSLYYAPIPDGLTDNMTMEEIMVALSLALGQCNADRAQVRDYYAED